MFIKFMSNAVQNGENNNVDFTVPVVISKFREFDVYEFKEPSSNEQNRIEVSDKNVNIFIGPNTINLDIHSDIQLEYITPNGTLNFIAKTTKIERKKNNIKFDYSLHQGENKLGDYKIILEINEEI